MIASDDDSEADDLQALADELLQWAHGDDDMDSDMDMDDDYDGPMDNYFEVDMLEHVPCEPSEWAGLPPSPARRAPPANASWRVPPAAPPVRG